MKIYLFLSLSISSFRKKKVSGSKDRQMEGVKGLIAPQLDLPRNDLTTKRSGNRTTNEKDLNRVKPGSRERRGAG